MRPNEKPILRVLDFANTHKSSDHVIKLVGNTSGDSNTFNFINDISDCVLI